VPLPRQGGGAIFDNHYARRVVVLIVALVLLALWGGGVLLATDLSVPAVDPRAYRNVLAVFPHADDEVVCCGGTLHRLARLGARVTLVVLTRGERGTPTGALDPGLGTVREREARAAAATLGVTDVVQADLGDGQLRARVPDLSAFLERTIARVQPDLLITYDLAGLYGHPDHVACAEVVTELRLTRFPECALWYAALPRGLLALARLAADPAINDRRALPTGRLFVGAGVLAKIRAWRVYASQRGSLGWAFPVWFSMTAFEHFEAVP
jgi:LmbE family N-acetylglucosaminyl deacetylase